MVTAKIHNVQNEFLAELKFSQGKPVRTPRKGSPEHVLGLPMGWRDGGNIKNTQKELGLPKNLFEGLTDIYRLVETSRSAREVVEDRKLGTSAKNVADVLADFYKNNAWIRYKGKNIIHCMYLDSRCNINLGPKAACCALNYFIGGIILTGMNMFS